jgi:SAM-dependent methyltransferase
VSARIESIMVEFFNGLDLLGPSDPPSTSRALASIAVAPDAVVVDVGCGTGRQTLQLLQETPATVIATDLHQAMLDRLQQLATEQGISDRLLVEQADMGALPFEPDSVDLLWCEGAIYNIGYEQGLRAWLPILRPGGHLCVSEGAYFVDNPPAAVREFWEAEYPAITTQSRLEQLATECGYVLVDSFRLPRSAWEAYYGPVEDRIDNLEMTWAGDSEREQVLAAMRHEIDVFRRYGDTYGYAFLVLKKPVHGESSS